MGQFNPTYYASATHSSMFPNAPVGLRFPGDPGMPANGVCNNYKNFMPRVGFAYDVFGTAKPACAVAPACSTTRA